MAYTPTLDDLPSGGSGYNPSLSDLPDANSLPQGLGARLLNTLGSGGLDAIAGLTKAGMGIANAPHNLVNLVSPQLASKIPMSPLTGGGIDQLFGTQNRGLGGDILEGAGQYAPYAAGGEGLLAGKLGAGALGRLGAQGLTGATFGATQSPNPISGALIGGGTNLALGVPGEALSALSPALKSYFSRFAAQGLAKNIGQSMKDTQATNNAQAFGMAKQNFDALSQNENSAWTNLKQQAAQVDSALPGSNFDDSGYINSLKNKLQDMGAQSSKQSGFARSNTESMQLLQDYMNDQHGTFTDAFQHNQALNKDYQNEITPGKSLPFSTINYAKGALKQNINENINNMGLQDTLGSAWNNANAITAQKNNIFNEVVNPKGKANISTFATINNLKNTNADPTTFVNDYLPTSKGDGIQKMQQFSQMLGDENSAKQVLKSNYFDKAIESSGVNPKKFLNRYNNLSDDQQNYLFSPQDNQTIQALNKINEMHPDALSHSLYAGLGHHGIAATLGGILGMSTGHGLWEGLGAGIAGGMVANAGLRKAFENPAISNYFMNYLTHPQAPAAVGGIGGGLGRALSPMITPSVVNSLGGQQNGY